MKVARRTASIATVALVVALAAPAAAHANEVPSVESAATMAMSAAIDDSRAANSLAQVEMRLSSVLDRITSVEARLPEGPAEEVLSLVKATAAAFLPPLADETDVLNTDRQLLEALYAERDVLLDERDAAETAATSARATAVISSDRADAARLAEAERAASERQARIGKYGRFPVDGDSQYIDSWGFARSGGRAHKGTDIMAKRGTPVVAVRDGVVRADSNRLGGRVVFLTTADGTEYYFAHLDTVAVSSGSVEAGDLLGTVGNSGNASGGACHLHFEIHPGGGRAVNPYPTLRGMVL